MTSRTSVVVTSISAPNEALGALAKGCAQRGFEFITIGDLASPATFHLEGCEFLDLEEQRSTGFGYAKIAPTASYCRKNIGYLRAIENGAHRIIDVDDDNHPLEAFWVARERRLRAPLVSEAGWVNVYRYFTDANVWPRGLPLPQIASPVPSYEAVAVEEVDAPIQQGLVNGDPDVDAIYRLIVGTPQSFREDRSVALGRGSWCPFNSQNTTFFRAAFPLAYLPATGAVRMTDIWRSLVAQRIGWENGWSLLFFGPSALQVRNPHDLMEDFADEIPGYLNNERIRQALEDLSLASGPGNISGNLVACYGKLVEMGILAPEELRLLEAWLFDLQSISSPAG